jgi:hypothetical protein
MAGKTSSSLEKAGRTSSGTTASKDSTRSRDDKQPQPAYASFDGGNRSRRAKLQAILTEKK